mmetsp:Transcript_10471/g.15963  ORF Transcript_10471/g.15963 Transcript_10471/m.15963 type:complete len:1224 (+) Transcript_10471:145-3816(+)|eukprot:CAMPEP_0185036250 /NCGR_PEP_ID=MMETSP1103-20130426/28937_1 /TAXON_ID=36769 /ORGANISM="Paraphysomonas bandaiensis, Strain Caron Lab Isolate" /LENGTH=1223 /DNA_ID=CAMNT_0027573729 /DNA_START=79 /DNA_END=3750 /DNA_ORIENTATION=+
MKSASERSPVKLVSLAEEPLQDTPEKEIIESLEDNHNYGEQGYLFSSIGFMESRKATLTPGPVYFPQEGPIRKTPGAGERPGLSDITGNLAGAFEHSIHLDRRESPADRQQALLSFGNLSPRVERKSSFGENYSLHDLVESIQNPHSQGTFSNERDELYPTGGFSGKDIFSEQEPFWPYRDSSYNQSIPRSSSKATKNLHIEEQQEVYDHSKYSGHRKHYLDDEDGNRFHIEEVGQGRGYGSIEAAPPPSLGLEFSPGKNIYSQPFYPQHFQQQPTFHPEPSPPRQPIQQPHQTGYSSQPPSHTTNGKHGHMTDPPPGYEPIYRQQPGAWVNSQLHRHVPRQQKGGYGAETKPLNLQSQDKPHLTTQQHPHPSYVQHPPNRQQRDVVGCATGSDRRSKSPKNRQEQVESPVSKSIYKNFVKEFKSKEGESVVEAVAYAKSEIPKIPEKVKWRVFIDVADTLKRNSRYDDAKYLYAKVCKEYPTINQGWLEWSKMEEECGHLEESLKILRRGARINKYNDVLLTKAIKQHERLNNIGGAREMLGRLQDGSIDDIWRTVLEGALLESRAGNIAVARKLLAALMNKISWYGPIYHEAFRLEEKSDLFDRALVVVQRGLSELPRYGPLWFGMLRLMERRDMLEEASRWTSGDAAPRLIHTRTECEKAICSISKELVWKIHFEQAQTEERAAEIVALGRHISTGKPLMQCRHELGDSARRCFTHSLMTCPPNLRWKVYLAGARMELSAGQTMTAKALLRQARSEVPEKSKYHVFLECSRLEEFQGNINSARKILLKARREIKNEWKLFLETVLVEARAGNVAGAVYLADKALSLDSGSGRLWALLVQLAHRIECRGRMTHTQASEERLFSGLDRAEYSDVIPPPEYEVPSKYTILSRALQVVPKSGEVWCEGARTLLNPLSASSFDLGMAQKYLSFAIQFTPQYGDSFIEYVRLEMLVQVLLPRVLTLLGVPWSRFMCLLERYDKESDNSGIFERGELGLQELRDIAFYGSDELWHDSEYVVGREKRRENMRLAGSMRLDVGHCTEAYKHVTLDRLLRRCVNADPNYGTAWFFCRTRPYDTPGAVLRAAHSTLVHEIVESQEIYTAAVFNYVKRMLEADFTAFGEIKSSSAPSGQKQALVTDNSFEVGKWLQDFEEASTSCPEWILGKLSACSVALVEISDNGDNSGTIFSSQDFVTALIKLNRVMYARNNSAEERRRMLFGVDQITP